jgi:hypothetical protein
MNWKAIVGAVVLLIVVVIGWYYVQYRQQVARLAGAKEIVEASYTKDGPVGHLKYVGIVNGPIDKVQDAVWGVENSSKMIENIKKSDLVKQEGNKKTILMQLKAGSLPMQQVVMEFTLDAPNHAVAFKTTQAQAADLDGAYRLEPVGADKTKLTYEAKQTDKIANPFPDGVIETAQREVFVNTVRGIEKSIGTAPAATPAS